MRSFAIRLSFLAGFLSLSEEILWVRTLGFAYRSLPRIFTFVLVCYLIGIAVGAALGKVICRSYANLYSVAGLVLIAGALQDVLTPTFIGNWINVDGAHMVRLSLMIALTAGIKSVLFPIVHHLGASASGSRVGRSMSCIYFANILGASLGPMLTGFLALNTLNVDQCFGIASACCLLASVECAVRSDWGAMVPAFLAAALLCSIVAIVTIQPGLGSFAHLAHGGSAAMTHFVQNRHGVIHTSATASGDQVFGGNVYDGIASVNVDVNPNRLDRVYLLPLMRPKAKRLLFVGLSTGAWVRAMEGMFGVQRIDAVEINPGYATLIRKYHDLSPLLDDPRMYLHVDDGRRWLRRNPQAQFDAVIENTAYYWRANAGNLTSIDYLHELKRHLTPGGVVIINSTGSYDVLFTAQSAFAYAYRYYNVVYASDEPITLDLTNLETVLRPDGRKFTLQAAERYSVAALLSRARLEPVDTFFANRHIRPGLITDDNLLTEYRDGEHYSPLFLRALAPTANPEFVLDVDGE